MTTMPLRGTALRADQQDRGNIGSYGSSDADWVHGSGLVVTPWEDRPHFTPDDRIPEHRVFDGLKLYRAPGKIKQAQSMAMAQGIQPDAILARSGKLTFRFANLGQAESDLGFTASKIYREQFNRRGWFLTEDKILVWKASFRMKEKRAK